MDAKAKTAVIFLRARQPSMNAGLDLTDVQRKQCMALAERLNATVIREYVEYGGTAAIDKRPQLKLMIDELRALRDVTYVIVTGSERLARKRDDWVAIELELTAAGAKFVTVSGTEVMPFVTI